MKRCKKCGSEIGDGLTYCLCCFNELHAKYMSEAKRGYWPYERKRKNAD